ncbi:hypothetical protein [Streptomyces aurantiogriseus]|uniref:Uncharacterized protein n=1 Tax=Streptomyces aurantiogriseus TaxID=66870 RepID=A0A918CMA9_9ACTN|nr:hypothetical protein [Streptomyces aurantiogriseus]GGR30639.1 hypothetical protein GCM10010251_53330 [Streptomyces aurantiogriseus]
MPDYKVGDQIMFHDAERSELLNLTAPVTPAVGTITKVDADDHPPKYTVQREDGSTTTLGRSDFLTQE